MYNTALDNEVRERWGHTAAYKAYQEKTRGADPASLAEGMDDLFAAFAGCMQSGQCPESDEAQLQVQALRDYITTRFYPCTRPILSNLGSMYAEDERFRSTIDRHGNGTAEYVSRAIAAYCR